MNKLSLTEQLAYGLLTLAQYTPFRGNGNSFVTGCETTTGNPNTDYFRQAKMEAIHFLEIFSYFKMHSPEFSGKTVLDLGSGYGGRTLEYASKFDVTKVVGIEPFESMVKKSKEYAQFLAVDNCEFRVCGHLDIPAEDGEFDAIISYDVMEHVQNPEFTLKEMRRVLRDEGEAFIVFTPYWGALSHHLNYITRLPFIHWLFSATTLVNAINHVLSSESGRKFGTAIQPMPQLSFNKKFMKLPTLNGIDGEVFLSLARSNGFEVVYHRYTPLVERFLPWTGKFGVWVNELIMRINPRVREGLNLPPKNGLLS